MAPSKRWMDLVDDRLSEAYEMGVQSFLNYAFERTGKNKKIRCPCVKCGNTYSGTRELVESHLKVYGIVQNYTFWYHHGERSGEPQSESDGDNGEEIEEDESENEMHEIIRDLYPEFSDVYPEFSDVAQIHKQDNNLIMEDLLSLSRGPTKYVTCYNGYLINGYRFRIEDIDKGLRTQNSGVVVVGDTGSETERRDYYGVLTEIIELQYLGGRRVVLFRCNWWDIYNKEKGVKIDEYGHISVNCQRLLKTNEPFVLANQASQVFYASDNVNKGGKVGQPPNLATIFFETRKKVDKLVEQETISRYDKIVEVTQAEPSLSNIELVEKCFGPQRHDHVVCYGGGLKPNAMRTSGSKVELQAKLRESQRENQSLRNRMDEMENEVRMIKEMLQRQQSNTSPPPSNGQTSPPPSNGQSI
uniref:Transposase-associated domain-containing protein n=1 Tax=Ananas comosus var. bracteatus TaxID=296719 RepID=A0A6V7Q5V5_ANACO|nr:unnamed protein product [Ananas comosus var. bracteatus]